MNAAAKLLADAIAAVALIEASKTFRKLRGYKGMPKLVVVLRAHGASLDSASVDASNAA